MTLIDISIEKSSMLGINIGPGWITIDFLWFYAFIDLTFEWEKE